MVIISLKLGGFMYAPTYNSSEIILLIEES